MSSGSANPHTDNPLYTSGASLARRQRPHAPATPSVLTRQDRTTSSTPAVPFAVTPAPTATRLTLDHQETYVGETQVEGGQAVPHGYGVLQSSSGHHGYIGGFSHGWRDGYGHLVTDRFSLWCRWQSNRPDMSHGAIRLDLPDQSRYSGMAHLRVHRSAPASAAGKAQLSKFSQWALQVRPCRQGWGEVVVADYGDRYCGEWAEDVPHGFGCYVTSEGDRYVGLLERGKFHGTGALISRSASPASMGAHLGGVRLDAARDHPCASATPCRGDGPWSHTVVLDGVWCHGRFEGEGHVTLPSNARVTAEWLGPSHAQGGETVWRGASRGASSSSLLGPSPTWRECFHWEPLLSGACDDVRRHEIARFASLRRAIVECRNSPDRTKANVTVFLQAEDTMVRRALKIFVRCFFFLYGTCSAKDTSTRPPPSAAAGPSVQTSRATGWCDLRQPFGGCIHGDGCPRYTQTDVDLALSDLLSFSCSMQRWVLEVLGAPAETTDGRMDSALDVLLNSSVEQHIGRWTLDTLLGDIGGVLSHLYEKVYGADEVSLQTAIHRLRNVVSLDDIGVEFARREKEEQLFNPYVDAIRCVERLCEGDVTLTQSLELVVQVSKEIDVATRLATSDEAGDWAAAAAVRGSPPRKSRKPFQSGSADDLLPIHQYVLIHANAPNLFVRAKLLCDLGAQPCFVDQTSQEGFCLTTLQVCVWATSQLHPLVRDTARVLVPSTVVTEAVQAMVAQSESWVGGQRQQTSAHTGLATVPDRELAQACRGYVTLWLPRVLDHVATAPGALSRPFALEPSVLPDPTVLTHLALATCPTAALLRWLCWRFAGSLLSAVGIRLDTRLPRTRWCAVEALRLEDVSPVTLANGSDEGLRAFCLVALHPTLPSLLLTVGALLSSIL